MKGNEQWDGRRETDSGWKITEKNVCYRIMTCYKMF